MTKPQLDARVLIIAFIPIVVLGLIAGIVIGLWIGWMVWPVQVANVDVSDLQRVSQEEYIVLTAHAYAYDHDLPHAQERLAQLNDPQINDRLALLAKNYAAENNPNATHVAALAVALGVQDIEIARIAATVTPTATLKPTPTATSTPTLTVIPSATLSPTTPTRTPTRRPTATRTPAPIAGPQWIPAFPTEWPGGVKYEPVYVASGQKFWHLVKAQYCDDNDDRNDCPNLPGGSTGTGIYIMLRDAGGGRTSAPLKVTKPDGSRATESDIGPEKSSADMCNCNYTYLANDWRVQVDGASSDTVSGMGLYSVRMKLPQAHVRYFLTFQLMTR